MRLFFIAIFIVAATAGCKSSKEVTKTETPAQQPSTETQLTETRWYLFELMGQTVERDENIPYLALSDSNQVNGNGGCNNYGGSYTLAEGNRLSFSPLFRTEMYCTGRMEVEDALMEVYEKVDNYTIVDGELHLHKAKMAPLAKFKTR